jgi:hypothetical protein
MIQKKKVEAKIDYASLPSKWAEFMHHLEDVKGKTVVEINIWKTEVKQFWKELK